MENKRKNIYIAIFVATTIVSTCIAVYFGITKKEEVNNLKVQLDELKQAENKTEEVNKESEDNNSINQVQEKVVEKYAKYNVETSNCLNNNDNSIVYANYIYQTEEFYGLELNVQPDKKTVGISVDVNKFKANLPDINIGNENIYKTYTFDKEIYDIFIGGFGQDIHTNEMAFFILSDGTVEYINIKEAIENDTYQSNGKISNLTDIVGIQMANVSSKDGPGGYITTIAYNKDGKFYDIDKELKK